MTANTSRRGFLKGAAAAGAVLFVGAKGVLAAAPTDTAMDPFVRINSDGTVVAIIKHVEKDQGQATGLTSLVAEELGVTMEQIE